jgi:hypothetical protein
MRVAIDICGTDGWKTFEGDGPDGSDRECYALPKTECRIAFWSAHMNLKLPGGHAVIWRITGRELAKQILKAAEAERKKFMTRLFGSEVVR